MTFLIAAAGTGGHVYPGLAVGEALVDRGVPRPEILYVGGSRLEAEVYPDEGFPFLSVEIRGLQRSLTPRNLGLPKVVRRARDRMITAIEERGVKAVLGMGGYVTLPAAMSARRLGVPFFHSEQNVRAGVANRVVARWARRSFAAFPVTHGLPEAEWVGNPVREPFWKFHRGALRSGALALYGVGETSPVVGVVGGSLGSDVINHAVAQMAATWDGPELQLIHLLGERFLGKYQGISPAPGVTWVRKGFEPAMESFYAAADLVIARAGGAVAELTATATPSILVPGEFGSSGHQQANARFLTEAGAAVTVDENSLERLGEVMLEALHPERLETMRLGASRIAKPDAAHTIAKAMIEAAS